MIFSVQTIGLMLLNKLIIVKRQWTGEGTKEKKGRSECYKRMKYWIKLVLKKLTLKIQKRSISKL